MDAGAIIDTMPVNPIVPDTYEIRVHFSRSDGEEMVNTFNVDNDGSVLDGTIAADLLAVITGAWTDNLIPLMSNSVTLDRVTITDLDVLNGPQFIYTPGLVGALSDNPIPNQVAAVVTWRTQLRGKSFRGRTYLGGFTEAHSVGGAPDATLFSAVSDWASDMFGGFDALTHPMLVVSRYTLNPTPPPPSIPRGTNIRTIVIGSNVDIAWKTQRRRALKG